MTRENDGSYKSLYKPALIVIYITALLYLAGYSYYQSFFLRLSIPFLLLTIQPIDYITAFFFPILILGICIAYFFSVWSHFPRSFLEALQGNVVIIYLFLFYSIAFLNLEISNEIKTPFILFCIIAILYIIYLSYKKISMAYLCFKKNYMILFLFGVIIFIYNLGLFFGLSDAENLIHGNNPNILEISLKDKTNNQFLNKILVLVMLHDNAYYVIERNATSSNYHKLYIVPIEQVEMVTVIRTQRDFVNSSFFNLVV